MNNHKVYVILSDTGTLFTRMIKLYTKFSYNHASIAFDDTFNDVYSFGRKRRRNPFVGGFVKENLQSGLFKDARCVIYSCEVSDAQLKSMYAFIERIENNKHLYCYNLLGLFGVAFNKQLGNRENAYFCSQFVAPVLISSNVTSYSKPASFIAPHDLLQAANFKLEYEGHIRDLYEESRLLAPA